MSLLNLAPPSGTVGANIVPENEEFKRPSEGKELTQQARRVGRYQSSVARSNLAEQAVENLMAEMSPEDREYIAKHKRDWDANLSTPSAADDDPMGVGAFTPRTDYEEMYRDMIGKEGSPLDGEAFTRAMAEELKQASTEETVGQENTLSNWPFLRQLAGGMLAGLEDPREQAGIVGSFAFGAVGAAKTVLGKLGLLAADVGASAAVTASYQPEVIALYKEMGLEDLYGPIDALVNVGAGVVLDVVMTGAGKAVGYTAGKAVGGVEVAAKKIHDYQNKAIRAGASIDEIDAATPGPVKKAKADGEEKIVTSAPDEAAPGDKKIAANRVRQVADDAAMGRTVDPEVTGKAQASKGPPAPSTEVAETSAGSVNPGVAIESAKAQDGKPFSGARVGREFVDEQKDTWITELAREIEAETFTPKQNSDLAHAVNSKSGLEANIEEQKKVVAYEKSEAKKYAGTDQQAETRKIVKDATGSLTSMRQSLKAMNDILKKKKNLDKLIDEWESLTKHGKLAPRSRYAKQVTAAKKAAKETHEARAAMGKTTAEIEGVSSARVEAMMDSGAVPDTRPSRVADEGGTDMDLDEPFKHSDQYYEEIDSIRRQQDSDMPDEDFMYDYDVDEDYNTTTRSGADLADDAEALDVAAEFIRGCM